MNKQLKNNLKKIYNNVLNKFGPRFKKTVYQNGAVTGHSKHTNANTKLSKISRLIS